MLIQQRLYIEELYAADFDAAVKLMYSRIDVEANMQTRIILASEDYPREIIAELSDDARRFGIEIRTNT